MTIDVDTLIRYATEPERRVLAAILQRAQAMPGVVVTLQEGASTRRYVAAREDEEDLRPLAGLPRPELTAALRTGRYPHTFGGQWLRAYGRVDEQYRTLPLDHAVAVQQVSRARIWGEPPRPRRGARGGGGVAESRRRPPTSAAGAPAAGHAPAREGP
jgi:hypothetical protein